MELRALVRRTVAELPELFQVVIVLYHMDRLSYEGVAQLLKIHESGFKAASNKRARENWTGGIGEG